MKLKIVSKKRLKVEYHQKDEQIIRFFYDRYADDWIILTNADKSILEQIKTKITIFLKEELKLDLSPEKTLITNIKNKAAKYLGYTIYIGRGIIKYNVNNVKTRYGTSIIRIGIDKERRIKGLIDKGYMDIKGNPREVPYLMSFEPQQIIEFYNSVIDGTINYYYRVITRKSTLNHIIYILYYSCLKTLASKYKTTINKLHQSNGWPEYNVKNQPTGRTRIVWQYQKTNKKNIMEDKYIVLRNYLDAMDHGKWISIAMNLNKSVFSDQMIQNHEYNSFYKLNWRTKFKYTSVCTICGSDNQLESHHVRKIGGPKAKKELTIMQKLNIKQIILCRTCHNNVHQGKYNDKKLRDLAEIRTTKVGNLTLTKQTQTDLMMLAKTGAIKLDLKVPRERPGISKVIFDNIQESLDEINKLGTIRPRHITLRLDKHILINHKEKAQQITNTKNNGKYLNF